MQFCNTPFSTCEEEPFGNTHVYRWQLLITKEKAHLCMQTLRAAMFQVSRGAYVLLRLLAVTENQETQWLLDEIQRKPSVYVLSCPATAITNIAAASAFPADGWSTESVSRVVRTTRTRQENKERERAEHVYYIHIHDKVTISDLQSQDQDSMKMRISQKTQQHRMTRKMKQNSLFPSNCRHDDKFRGFNMNIQRRRKGTSWGAVKPPIGRRSVKNNFTHRGHAVEMNTQPYTRT